MPRIAADLTAAIAALIAPTPETWRYDVVLRLPYPPSVNHYWGTRGKARFIRFAGYAFRASVRLVVIAAGNTAPLTGGLFMSITLYPPDRRRRDIDNTQKAILDALQHAGVYADDNQIDALLVCRGLPMDGGGALVQIAALPGRDGEGGAL